MREVRPAGGRIVVAPYLATPRPRCEGRGVDDVRLLVPPRLPMLAKRRPVARATREHPENHR